MDHPSDKGTGKVVVPPKTDVKTTVTTSRHEPTSSKVKKEGKKFWDDPENRKKVKVAAAVTVGVVAVALGAKAIKERNNDVDPETGLKKAQKELEGAGRHWWGKAKKAGNKAGHKANETKGWFGDKASQAKHAAGDAGSKTKNVLADAGSNVKHSAEKFGHAQKEAEQKLVNKAAEKSEKSDAAMRSAADSVSHHTGKAYKKSVDFVDDKLHPHRKNLDGKEGGGCSIM